MTKEQKYNYICSGYLVENKKVLLVLHNVFHFWVPPGGHVDENETFSEAAEREFSEETGLRVQAISSAPIVHPQDKNATPLPLPFYTDVMVEGFKKPTIGQYYFMRRIGGNLVFDKSELDGAQWFSAEELNKIKTFDQVRSVAKYAIENYPKT